MHVQSNGTKNPVGVIHQSNKVAQGRFAPHVQHAFERRMVVAFLADLDEEDAVTKMVHHFLPAAPVPPFNSVVVFPPCGYNPVGSGLAHGFFHDGWLCHFLGTQVNVALEAGGSNLKAKLLVQVFDEPVDEMIRRVVASVNERIVAEHRLHIGVLFVQRRDVRIVLPERRAGSTHVRQKTPWIGAMKIPDRRRKHNDVTR